MPDSFTPARRTALQTFKARKLMPTHMSSEDLATQLTGEQRQLAFFMAKVQDTVILQRFRDEAEAVLRGEYDEATAIARLGVWLDEIGYKPPANKAGGLEDLSSLDRRSIVLRVNVDMARGYAKWLRQMEVIDQYPAQRLIRVAEREVPRLWKEERWPAAYEKTKHIPGAHPTEMVALIDHPIWIELSAFGNPYTPLDFNSGMGFEPVPREETERLGLLPPPASPPDKPAPSAPESAPVAMPTEQPPATPAAPVPSSTQTTASEPNISNPALKEKLAEDLGRMGEWDGKQIIFTDPNGTRPFTAEKLADVWKKSAPVGYDALPQRDALDRWTGGDKPVSPADEFHLLRLFSRIETPTAPASVRRSFPLAADVASDFFDSIAEGVFLAIPAYAVAWAFTDREEEPLEIPQGDWAITVKVEPSGHAIDIRELRPGKAGFVYVGGTRFKVERVEKNDGAKTATVTVAEA